MKTWIHTYGGYSIEISPKTRIPRDCNRFFSLMEQLFAEGAVPPGVKEPLMTLTQTTLENMLKKIKPTYVIALSSHGEQTELEELSNKLVRHERPLVLVGAFPHGPMKPETFSLADEVLSIYPEPLEAWVVTSRIIYEYEKARIRIERDKS